MYMIDVHCHILYRVDDASQRSTESLDMLKVAAADGVKVIAATSHIKPPMYENTKADLQQALENVQALIDANHLDIEVILGAENFLNHKSMHLLDEDGFVTYGDNGKYMLVEFAWTKNVMDKPTSYLQRIIDKGYIPVVAHPERYQWVHEDYELVRLWRKMGCLMQVNRTSVLQLDKMQKANEFATRLLEDDLVDCIATDSHAPYAPRLPKLSDVYTYISKHYGEAKAKSYLTDVPQQIISK